MPTRPPYPAEYKAELVRLVRDEGRSPNELAREFEPSVQSIINWVAQAEIDTCDKPGLSSDEKAELKRLRSENRVLKMEKEILEKAAAFFAAKNNPTRYRCSSSFTRRRPTSQSLICAACSV